MYCYSMSRVEVVLLYKNKNKKIFKLIAAVINIYYKL